jgi:YHS domain-containing protein
MNRKRIILFLIGIVVLSVVGFLGYQRLSASAQSMPTSTPAAKSKEDIISAEGNVVPKSASDLAFRTGGRVAAVLVSEGGMVKRGQSLILADEPTANLDSKIGHEVMRLLRSIAKEQQRSVVIVSHDQRIKDIADRVMWLEDGQFKQMTTMAIDPVCGMSVEQEKAIAAEWNEQRYYFCAKGCRDEFLTEPHKFSARKD